MPAGGLSVPSCSEPGRSYWVSLAGEVLVWAAKQRRALVLAGRRAA